MKTLLIINCIVALVTLILATEIVEATALEFRKDYPNAELNVVPIRAKIIGSISLIVRALIPIYNLICVVGFLFMRDTMIEKGYEVLVDRIVKE